MLGVRLALSWLTVLPVRGPERVDRSAGGRAIAATPLTGALLGAGAAGLLWLLLRIGLDPALAGLLCVGAHALATRGMHVDGLSDTADGLGCYGPPERAREVMRGGGAGPFGVTTLVVVLGAQALAFGALAGAGAWIAVAVAMTAGRVAVVIACRRGTEAAVDRGFGALVAGTQSPWIAGSWTAALLAVSPWCADQRWWQGPLVVLFALALSMWFVRHCAARFGGLSGDVLGAALEFTVTATAVGLACGL